MGRFNHSQSGKYNLNDYIKLQFARKVKDKLIHEYNKLDTNMITLYIYYDIMANNFVASRDTKRYLEKDGYIKYSSITWFTKDKFPTINEIIMKVFSERGN
jgi:hypothetical protein